VNGTNGNIKASRTVGILIFPDVEILDFCGPFEVFSVARLEESERRDTESPFRVLTVAEVKEPLKTAGGLTVIPDYDFATCPKLDVLVVPGGWGTRPLMNSQSHLDWIRKQANEVDRLTSVCTGSLLLGSAGLLVGRSATTHFRAFELFRESFPNVTLERHLHVVEDGNILTSAGISAGIDMAIMLVRHYYGEEVARTTSMYMEYPYPENNTRRVRVGNHND
jgi:transcriptional regulator GlxA family with amidase domain